MQEHFKMASLENLNSLISKVEKKTEKFHRSAIMKSLKKFYKRMYQQKMQTHVAYNVMTVLNYIIHNLLFKILSDIELLNDSNQVTLYTKLLE